MSLHDLEKAEKKIRSQGGEDGVIEAIFREIGTTNQFFVEFGADDAVECNGALLLEQGWHGLMMDGDGISHNPRARVHQEFITAENINDLFAKYKVPTEFDLLSIDIDSNDYWVWKALASRPRVVVIEYNASVPPDLRRSIVYDPKARWKNTDYFGASLRALAELGAKKGYELVYCERAGVNAFFVERSALPADFIARPVEQIYRAPNYFYQGLGHPPDMERLLIDPEANGLFERAVSAHQRQEHELAEKLYSELIETNPSHADAHDRFGLLKHERGLHREAAVLIRRALALCPLTASYQFHLGQALKEMGQIDEAMASYRIALEEEPDHIGALKHLGLALREKEDFAQAAECFRSVLRVYPHEVDAHNNLGNILHRLGHRAEAIACFRQALSLNPKHASAYNNLGIALAIEGQTEDAIASFREALRLKPQFVNALQNLGLILKRQGQLDEAEQCYREAQRLHG